MENKKGKLGSRLAGSEAFLSVAASLICIVIGLLLGLVVLAIINAEHAFGDGLLVILKSGFKSPRNMGTVLANAAPLIMTGLSVGFAFKTGLFNIGAAGQYTLGAFGALYCAIVLQWPWYLCLLAAMLFGAIWGALPGIFKAYLNINEVITAIMFNWIGLYMVNDIMYGKGKSPMYDLLNLVVPKGMLYDDVPLNYQVKADSGAVAFTYQLNDKAVPLHAACELCIGLRRKPIVLSISL